IHAGYVYQRRSRATPDKLRAWLFYGRFASLCVAIVSVRKGMTMSKTADLQFLTWLKTECGYRDVRALRGHRYVAILPMIYTHRLVVGKIGDEYGHDDGWCYSSYEKALDALNKWDGTGEPTGWHRHPGTGRRRIEGDAESE